jgi:hypothetical protein
MAGFVEAVIGTAQGPGTTYSIDKPASAQVGDLLVVGLMGYDPDASSSVFAPETGWTRDSATAASNDGGLTVFTREVDGGEASSFTFDVSVGTCSGMQGICGLYRGELEGTTFVGNVEPGVEDPAKTMTVAFETETNTVGNRSRVIYFMGGAVGHNTPSTDDYTETLDAALTKRADGAQPPGVNGSGPLVLADELWESTDDFPARTSTWVWTNALTGTLGMIGVRLVRMTEAAEEESATPARELDLLLAKAEWHAFPVYIRTELP